MAGIPTESRIFADRYCREARRIEALHAARLSPGTATWGDAALALYERMSRAGPIKAAAMLRQADATLQAIAPAEAMHIRLLAGSSGKRAAGLLFATFHAGQHPFKLDEQGLHVLLHTLYSQRSGARMLADVLLTYISWHAMARLHERGHRLSAGAAFNVFGFLGILGLLTRHSAKHACGGMCLHYRDILAVGSLKEATMRDQDGHLADGTFYDVRTVLPADEVRDQAMLEQGRAASAAVKDWIDERTIARAQELAERIPFLPRREDDYTLRASA